MKELSDHLGKNLVDLRHRHGITQGELAKRAGIPRSTIAHMESGSGNPTLSNLAKIAAALQVTVEELLAAPRAGGRLVKSRDLERTKRSQGAVIVTRLLPDPIPGMVLDRMDMEEGARLGGVPHVAGAREYFTCIRGEVTVHVGGSSYAVEEGDVLTFAGDQAHSYGNSGRGRAVAISVVVLAPPGF